MYLLRVSEYSEFLWKNTREIKQKLSRSIKIEYSLTLLIRKHINTFKVQFHLWIVPHTHINCITLTQFSYAYVNPYCGGPFGEPHILLSYEIKKYLPSYSSGVLF